MKAILFPQYGSPDVLRLTEVEKPTPNENQVLVKVYTEAANPLDWHRMRGEPFLARLDEGFFKPKNPKLGADIAGRVETVGKNVTEFKPGDEVIGSVGSGGFAEYVCAREKYFVLKPENVSFEAAAAAPVVGFTALQGLRDAGQIQAGQKVLVNGASGGVGTFAVQIAKSYGAEVTGVCSTRNLEMGLNRQKNMSMRAVVYTSYGSPDVLELKEVAQPVPRDDEVLVKVHAAAANYADWALLHGKPFLVRAESGLLKPKNTILGADIAGRVAAVGKNVRQFQPGDAVFGDISACGWGGFAEYVAVPEKFLALKPENVTFEQAAAAPLAGVTALQGLRDYGHLQPGQKVLINGASGGVGTFAVQIAKAFGAEVTAVCSTSKLEMVRAIGADHVIDYTKEDFTRNGQQYDLILGANGQHSLAEYKRALRPRGTYVCSGGSLRQIFAALILGPLLSSKDGIQLRSMGTAKPNQKDLLAMQELLATGKVVPVLDKCYPLPQVPDALRYLGEGHAKGKVIITLEKAGTHRNSEEL